MYFSLSRSYVLLDFYQSISLFFFAIINAILFPIYTFSKVLDLYLKSIPSTKLSFFNQSLSVSTLLLFLPSGVRGLSGAAGPDRYLHARQDPHAEDLSHPDLPSSLVAEDPREHRYGLVSGAPE